MSKEVEFPEDYRPNKQALSNSEVRATGILCGGAVHNIARELIESRAYIATLSAQVEELSKRALIARRSFHNLNMCNQYFERCEHPTCNPDAPLAMLESSTFSAIPGDRVKLDRIAELEAELAALRSLYAEEIIAKDTITLELAALREGATVAYRADVFYSNTNHWAKGGESSSSKDAVEAFVPTLKQCGFEQVRIVEVITRERILDTMGDPQ